MNAPKRARYVNLSSATLDLLDLCDDQECVTFVRWLIRATEGLYEGIIPTLPDTHSKVLEKAIKAEINELYEGFHRYQQRASGNRKEPLDNQCLTNGRPNRIEQIDQTDRPVLPASVMEALKDAGFDTGDENTINFVKKLYDEFDTTDLISIIRKCVNAERSKIGYLMTLASKIKKREDDPYDQLPLY